MKKATEQNPPLSASTAVNSCKTELGSGTPSSAGAREARQSDLQAAFSQG